MSKSQLQQVISELQLAKEELVQVKRSQGVRSALSHAPIIGQHGLVLFVGPDYNFFTMHTDLLPKSTLEYINARTPSGGFAHLPDQSAELMIVYRAFLYTGRIYSNFGNEDMDMPDDGQAAAHEDREWVRLANLYYMAVEIRDEVFGNRCLDALVEKSQQCDRYPTGMASEVYMQAKACRDTKLQKLYVDFHVWGMQGTGVHPPHGDAHGPFEFQMDVLSSKKRAGSKVYREDIKSPWEKEAKRCIEYHTHNYTDLCGIEVIDLTEC